MAHYDDNVAHYDGDMVHYDGCTVCNYCIMLVILEYIMIIFVQQWHYIQYVCSD